MVKVEADPARQLMVVRYGGEIAPVDAEKALNDTPGVLTRLEEGFRLLVDMTELQKMDLACAPHIEKIMDLCQEKGVSDVVRVIPDPKLDIGLQIMSHFHYASHVHIATCGTIEEAMRMLSEGSGEN